VIEQIKNIGSYSKRAYPDRNAVDSMLNEIDRGSMESILEINIEGDAIDTNIRDFDSSIAKDALFYQAGNGALGGGIRLDFYKDSKVESACDFCEVSSRYGEIKSIIENFIKENGKNAFAIIKVNGKTPRELFEKKFLEKMYSTAYKKVKDKHICHLCGKNGQCFNTTTYKFYTNDKSIYGNVDNNEKTGFVICEDCLTDVIVGRKYIDDYLSAYWINNNVMFLPHTYNEDSASIYETSSLNEKMEQTKFLNNIRINEEDVIGEIGKTNAVTDIVFYQEDSKFFYIYHVIQSVLPSRFSLVAGLLKRYSLKLFTLFSYAAAVKITLENIETTDKERIRILDSIFSGKLIDRSSFFKRAVDVYKYHYLKDEHKKYASMRTINRIYNFLCDCDCLEKGWNVLKTYRNYEELFDGNEAYFDTNEKKAWFILGKAYSTMIYYIKPANKDGANELESEKTSLEKNFFFARKFDFSDFVYFCNLLEDKAIKYKKSTVFFKKMICEAKEYIANRENRLAFDEAKYLFFWGLDSYFNNEQENNNQEDLREE